MIAPRNRVVELLSRRAPPSPVRDPLVVEIVQRFCRSGSVTLCVMFHGLRPKWAWAAYCAALEAGYLVEDADARADVTAEGWAFYRGGE